MDLLQVEEEETTLATKTVINMTGKTVPIINTGTRLIQVTIKTFSVTQAKSELFVLRNTKQI